MMVTELYHNLWQIELFFYEKFIIMRSHSKFTSDYQDITSLLLISALHNNIVNRSDGSSEPSLF